MLRWAFQWKSSLLIVQGKKFSWSGSLLKVAARKRKSCGRVGVGGPLHGKVITGCVLTLNMMTICLHWITVCITEYIRPDESGRGWSLLQVKCLRQFLMLAPFSHWSWNVNDNFQRLCEQTLESVVLLADSCNVKLQTNDHNILT